MTGKGKKPLVTAPGDCTLMMVLVFGTEEFLFAFEEHLGLMGAWLIPILKQGM